MKRCHLLLFEWSSRGIGNNTRSIPATKSVASPHFDEPLMPVFDFQFNVKAPLADVSQFHHDTSALKKLTPPPTIVQLHKIEPLSEGSVSTFTLWVGPLPLKWKAVHKDVSENGFTDIQAEGPAKKWEHTHSFIEISPSETQVNEHIEYEHKSGFWGLVTRSLFAKPNLLIMFHYRRWVTQRALNNKS